MTTHGHRVNIAGVQFTLTLKVKEITSSDNVIVLSTSFHYFYSKSQAFSSSLSLHYLLLSPQFPHPGILFPSFPCIPFLVFLFLPFLVYFPCFPFPSFPCISFRSFPSIFSLYSFSLYSFYLFHVFLFLPSFPCRAGKSFPFRPVSESVSGNCFLTCFSVSSFGQNFCTHRQTCRFWPPRIY